MSTDQIVSQIISAAEHKQWLLLFVLAIIGLTSAVRWLGPKLHDKFGALVTSDRGGQLTSLIIAEGMAVVAALTTGRPITLTLVVGALVGGAGAGGLYNLVKNLLAPSDRKTASAKTPPPTPSAGRASIVVLMMLVAGFGLLYVACFGGCKTPQGQAALGSWKTCELGQLPAEGQSVLVAADNALGQESYQQNLTQLGFSVGESQLNCAIQALVTYYAAQPSTTAATLTDVASYSAKLVRAKTWLAAHPKTSCRLPSVASVNCVLLRLQACRPPERGSGQGGDRL